MYLNLVNANWSFLIAINMEKKSVSKRKLHDFLDKLKAGPGDYITLYIRSLSFPYYIDDLSLAPEYSICIDEIRELVRAKPAIQEIEKYGTGVAVFWQRSGNRCMVLPPFPINKDKVSLGELDTSIIYEALERKYAIGVVLVTWGSYAVGVFCGDRLVDSKVGTGYIHKEHKKGGSSQKRFARRTEEQKKNFLRKVSGRIEERFKNHALDYIFFGGNRLIGKPLLKECACLKAETYKISEKLVDVRYADKEALDNSLKAITKSLILIY